MWYKAEKGIRYNLYTSLVCAFVAHSAKAYFPNPEHLESHLPWAKRGVIPGLVAADISQDMEGLKDRCIWLKSWEG